MNNEELKLRVRDKITCAFRNARSRIVEHAVAVLAPAVVDDDFDAVIDDAMTRLETSLAAETVARNIYKAVTEAIDNHRR